MRLEGSLDAFSLPDIFSLLSMTKKTGGLHVRREGAHGVVWLSSGALTGGASAIGRQGLLRRVVSGGGVSADVLQAAAEQAGAQGTGIVSVLLSTGAVDEDRVRSIAAEHVVDTVFDLLRWDSGDFEFVVDEPNRDPVGVERSVDEVVTEARRRLEEWNQLRDTLPAPSTILRIAGSPPGAVTLDPEQWSLLVLADGRRTVADMVDLSGRGEYVAVRTLADLVRTGVLCETSAADSGVADQLGVLAVIEGLPGPVASTASAGTAGSPVPADARESAAVASSEALVAEESAGTQTSVPPSEGLSEEPVDETGGDGDGQEAVQAAPTPLRPGREAGRVTPQRADPFRPSRTPEHPDGSSVAPSTVGALAAVTAPASHIERDPSVNKSLLLRLIAGVRGL